MREKIQAARTKMVAAKYGNPASSLSIVVLAGDAGKTTVAQFLAAILKESGRSVACLTNDASITSAGTLYERLAALKKQRVQSVVLEINEQLLTSGALHGLPIETLIVTNENEVAHQLLRHSPKHVIVPTGFTVPSGSVEPYQHISVGEDDTADAKVEDVRLYRHGTELIMKIDHQTKLEVATYYAGKANALSLATAIAASYVLGISLGAVQEGVAEMEPPEGAFYWRRTNQPYEVVHDVAERDDSIRLATASAKQLVKRRLIVAFAGMPQDETLHFVKSQADRVFAVGASELHEIDSEANTQDVYDKALRTAKRDDTVLLIGADFLGLVSTLDTPEETS